MTAIIHCLTCRRNSPPKIVTASTAKPIRKCGHCNSISHRPATKDERENVTPLPVKVVEDGLKLFGI